MRRLILLTAFALCACGGGERRDSDSRPAAADAASNFSQPIDVRGGDPAWGLKIRGVQFTLDQPNQPMVTATAPGAVIQPHTASWNALLPDGRTMKVCLFASACTDPATGATYPFAAEVVLPGAAPLDGCGGPPAGTRTPPTKPAAVARR